MKELIPYFKYLQAYKWQYLGGILAGVVNGAASGFGLAFVAAKVLPLVFSGEKREGWLLIGVVLMVPAVAVIRGLSGFISSYLMAYCNAKICLSMRAKLMNFMQLLSLSFYHRNRTGAIMARVLQDTERISSAVTAGASDLVRQPITIIGAVGVMFYLAYTHEELYLLIILFILLPVCVLFIRWVGRRMTQQEKRVGQNEGALHSIIHEHLESAKETRAFNLQEREQRKFEEKAVEQMSIRLKVTLLKLAVSPLIEIIASIGVAVAILYSALAEVPLEAVIPLLMALYVCYKPFKKLGTVYADIKRATMASDRIKKIYTSRDRLSVAEHPRPCHEFRDAIQFERVFFTYGRNARAIKKVSVTINKGDVVALVGPSGSGKSTFCNLICRFYDPTRGTITYDGIDLKDFDESQYREHIALVPQDTFLFADTIMNNIRLGRLSASDEEVVAAAKKAFAHDFIQKCPNQYETVLAERGASLSGGQRQRIAIARAFLKNAEILILDEATSSLDADSEEEVYAALRALVRDKTVIIIAHRYSTVRMANRILLFEKGAIDFDGPEEELEARSEFFRNLKLSGSGSSAV